MTSVTALVAAVVVGSLVARIRQLAGTDELTGLANRRIGAQLIAATPAEVGSSAGVAAPRPVPA